MEIKSYTLKNDFLEIELLNLGAIIRKIEVKNKKGNKKNIVLSYDNIEEYKKNPAYLGAIIGRTAGRIKNGILNIDENEYQLEKNNGNNNLHGGENSISHKFWKVKKVEKNLISFEIFSKDLENFFPANVNIRVDYILKNNEFLIKYFASADRKTYINLTNHTYFNLNGNSKTEVYNHTLKLNSDYMYSLDENYIPQEIINLKNSLFSFKTSKLLKDFFKEDSEQKKLVNNGIDHPFIIKKNEKFMKLENKETGISLEMITDNPAVVIYTGNFLKDINFKNHSGICFETQEVPDLKINKELKIFPSFIDENKNYERFTKFIFNIT